jgi:hypothetical protein
LDPAGLNGIEQLAILCGDTQNPLERAIVARPDASLVRTDLLPL